MQQTQRPQPNLPKRAIYLDLLGFELPLIGSDSRVVPIGTKKLTSPGSTVPAVIVRAGDHG